MLFSYRAITSDGAIVADAIDAASRGEAAEALRAEGLAILELDAADGDPTAAGGPAGRRARTTARALVVFTRQMKMLLESGASLVPALTAIEEQFGRSPFARTIRDIRKSVESGGNLSDAFAQHPRIFRPFFCTIVAAGEATGQMSEAFERLSRLVEHQERINRTVVGAMLYPALLAVMCLGVVNLMFFFVLPRFRTLFDSLHRPLPATTRMMFAIADAFRDYWPVALGVLLAVLALVVWLAISPLMRPWRDAWLVRVPWVGRMVGRLIFGNVLRIWAAMLRCHVPLIETIQQSRNIVRNHTFRRMIEQMEESVASGGRLGDVLRSDRLVDPIIVSAIATGEENGRLAEAVDFVSRWVDADNEQMIAMATRILEPAMLGLMGLIVGGVAMSLFLPLFDMATVG